MPPDARPGKDRYYIDIARAVAQRGTCQLRNYGAVIVSKDDHIVSTGYNGAPRGMANCIDSDRPCARKNANHQQGERYDSCRSVHAEMNAVIHVSRGEMQGATLYLVGVPGREAALDKDPEPCQLCKRLIINAGITTVIAERIGGDLRTFAVTDWVAEDLGV